MLCALRGLQRHKGRARGAVGYSRASEKLAGGSIFSSRAITCSLPCECDAAPAQTPLAGSLKQLVQWATQLQEQSRSSSHEHKGKPQQTQHCHVAGNKGPVSGPREHMTWVIHSNYCAQHCLDLLQPHGPSATVSIQHQGVWAIQYPK